MLISSKFTIISIILAGDEPNKKAAAANKKIVLLR